MSKLKCKYKGETLYQAEVKGIIAQATGRSKREAVKRIRAKFLEKGISTRPSMIVDLLQDGKEVHPVG